MSEFIGSHIQASQQEGHQGHGCGAASEGEGFLVFRLF